MAEVKPVEVSIIIPTYNGSGRITKCLRALKSQTTDHPVEILVIDDGSTDDTVAVASSVSGVRVFCQANAGPAAARNRGALEARGAILLFTDDDCVPTSSWLDAMLHPFLERDVIGAKGAYRTHQKALTARFVQLEYEDKYRLMASKRDIDFIDTYSAGYRKFNFLKVKGYDLAFPVACAEDVELSYRMSSLNWKMRFAPNAIVYHTHPDRFWIYLRKKFKFAYWRVLAVSKHPDKVIRDSHTPQLMKIQLLIAPALVAAAIVDIFVHLPVSVFLLTAIAFFLTTLPFAIRSFKRDRRAALISPAMLAARACAQFAGIALGAINARRVMAERADETRFDAAA